MNDLIILEDDDLNNIFDLVNAFQIVFHPYYAMEGKFTHYKEYLMNKKDKIIILDRNISNSLFHQVCQICEIDSIVAKKSLRYDSLLDPDSTNISGGEKQRIILARGLLKDSKIIILDEALSEVDISLENKIIKNIRNFYKNNTLIYISHKNQIKNFENIINIGEDNGIL